MNKGEGWRKKHNFRGKTPRAKDAGNQSNLQRRPAFARQIPGNGDKQAGQRAGTLAGVKQEGQCGQLEDRDE